MTTNDLYMLSDIVERYGLNNTSIQPFGSGLINHTWIVTHDKKRYILQKINTSVFKDPEAIASNLKALDNHFKKHSPDYLFVKPLCTNSGEELVVTPDNQYFRLFPFIEGSRTYDTVTSPQQAYEAAQQFGKFTRLLSDFNANTLAVTLPNFHNLSLRYTQFCEACEQGSAERIAGSAGLIDYLSGQKEIVDDFEELTANGTLKKRVTHHDTKISNILFNDHDKGLCVIDLDTVMSGYFISDVGDMMRTYLSPVSEEENDLSLIHIREDYFEAIVRGYLSEMKQVLSDEEKQLFVYSGKYMIYMQALRFLTDHLNMDRYYGARYPNHNFNRAKNQIGLLQQLVAKEALLRERVEGLL